MKKRVAICFCGISVFVFCIICLTLNMFPGKAANKSIIDEYMQEYAADTYEPLYPRGGDWSNTETHVHSNPDYCAWISIPGTSINYPVCQTTDNEYYLNHDFDGRESKNGCIFIDYQSNIGDKNTVIYGHNFGSESTDMFSTLLYYENPDWYSSHRTIKFALDEQYMNMGSHLYKIFAAVQFNTKNLDEFDYMQRNWDSDSEFFEWIDYIYEHSLYDCDTNITPEAQILTLSTCNRVYGVSNRFLIFAYKEGAT